MNEELIREALADFIKTAEERVKVWAQNVRYHERNIVKIEKLRHDTTERLCGLHKNLEEEKNDLVTATETHARLLEKISSAKQYLEETKEE